MPMFKPGDRARIKEPRSIFHGMECSVVSHLINAIDCRIGPIQGFQVSIDKIGLYDSLNRIFVFTPDRLEPLVPSLAQELMTRANAPDRDPKILELT
jgi:hypothetical protein